MLHRSDPPRQATTPSARRAPLLTTCVLALAVLTGCGGATETVATAVENSASAVATARLALSQDMAGKLTRAATSTTLDDSLKEFQTSRSTVLKLSPSTAEDRDVQHQALEVLDGCAAAFTTARAAVSASDGGAPPSGGSPSSGAPSLADGDRALAAAADALKNLQQKVGEK
ncbi:hypothetical protein [Pseudarthrobacter sulfonivorans]|uniref:hypothetical protein n=1 Tax=Pseudarthrobacter sulfonivorans TaxID=121292 RepID=UPI0021075B04|nr:hypothetical protein [Pseudarthrobacter sulfonivorans]